MGGAGRVGERGEREGEGMMDEEEREEMGGGRTAGGERERRVRVVEGRWTERGEDEQQEGE